MYVYRERHITTDISSPSGLKPLSLPVWLGGGENRFNHRRFANWRCKAKMSVLAVIDILTRTVLILLLARAVVILAPVARIHHVEKGSEPPPHEQGTEPPPPPH
jgi:hypothetical protein